MIENGHKELLEKLNELLCEEVSNLIAISEMLTTINFPQARVLKTAIDQVRQNLNEGNGYLIKEMLLTDERDEYLDNLRGYFNEKTGTWYEQICQNFHQLTGFRANKWDALIWTIHLSLGDSTFDYLLHAEYIRLAHNGKIIVDDLRDGEMYGWDIVRIQHLLDTDFEELKNGGRE